MASSQFITDILYHGSGAPSGAPSVLSGENAVYIDETNHVLYWWEAGGSAWHTTTVLSNPMTTQDDIIIGGSSGTPARLGKGSDGQVLTVDPTTHHLLWATPTAAVQTTKGDLAGFSSVAARVPVGTNGQVLTADSSQTLGLKWGPASGTLVKASAQLASDVTLTSANTAYDGPSITPVAGTHAIWANATVENTSGVGTFTVKLWDGTTVLASGSFTSGAATYSGTIPMVWFVVADGLTAYKITALCNTAGGVLKAACPSNGAGNNATSIFSLQIA